ncbi:CotS family spore coat protein [Clostridium rectalis]|uniref:CotS family spore coat protein n=1 Tax=Clostridium rectalis TaxID=2040295 RepID=UPI000F634790|nr:CotS family spore coat protein [Clostridium rectalis]
MQIDGVKALVEEKYDLNIQSIEKIKNVYKIYTNEDNYCLKVINYNFPHFLFILSAIKHLQNNGFEKIPEIIKNKKKEDYISIEKSYAYLTPWINCRECNYDNPLDLKLATIKLAQLHNKSLGFNVTDNMNPRIGWKQWEKSFKNKKQEIIKFRNIIIKKWRTTEFDNAYLKSMSEEIRRIDEGLKNLQKTNYFNKMREEMEKKGFCHHDYAHHNILIEDNKKVNLIDFDYCILDTHLHDLCSLIIRVMKNGKWDIKNAINILDCYSNIYPIKQDDIPIMAAFIEFPQAYWQLGIQYYFEKQPWGEEFFINKLAKICEDKDERQGFVNEFRILKYG